MCWAAPGINGNMLCLNQVRCKQYVGARHESIICPGCGCLCDDLDVTVEGDRIVEVTNVCLWGVSRFFHAKKFHPKKERHRLLDAPGPP